MLGGFIAFWAFFRLLRAALIDAPQWIIGFFACCCLSAVVWLHRRHRASCNLSGGVVAAALLARHQIDTKVYRVEAWMADCYYPKKNAILLSPRNFEGTTVSALGIAAHEVAHVLQRKHWYVPYWLAWLIQKPAHVALAACFWLYRGRSRGPALRARGAGMLHVLFAVPTAGTGLRDRRQPPGRAGAASAWVPAEK